MQNSDDDEEVSWKKLNSSWVEPLEFSDIPNNWQSIFSESKINLVSDNISQQLESIGDFKSIFPPKNLVFNAFNHCKFENIKVVILGQDCYHGRGQAMGLSFSVPNSVEIPPSLRNIYKELEDDPDIEFDIPQHGNLTNWANQGILLLNSALTVVETKPGSHMKYWEDITDDIVINLSNIKEGIIFVLWGNFAKKKEKLINPNNNHYVLHLCTFKTPTCQH